MPGADVGELVLAAVEQPVASADDVGRAVVELADQRVEPLAGLDVQHRVVGPGDVSCAIRSPSEVSPSSSTGVSRLTWSRPTHQVEHPLQPMSSSAAISSGSGSRPS